MMDRTTWETSLKTPLDVWGTKTKEEVRALLGDAAAEMVGYDQHNPHHYYDLFFHTLHTVDGMPQDPILRTTAFFHDIGKPPVMAWKNGCKTFHGHPKKSAEIAGPILEALGYGSMEREKILFFISHHDDFMDWRLPGAPGQSREVNPQNLTKYRRKTRRENPVFLHFPESDLWHGLFSLCHADASAQADEVWKNGVLINSKAQKLRKLDEIQRELEKLVGE